MKKIDQFLGPHRFLSNFWMCDILYEGERYTSVEHAFQAAKTNEPELKEQIRNTASPGAAKRLGKLVMRRTDWEDVKEQIMLDLLRIKFKDKGLARLLILTGDALLIEGNTWGDTYWGVCNGEGKNRLGNLLMQVREETRVSLKLRGAP